MNQEQQRKTLRFTTAYRTGRFFAGAFCFLEMAGSLVVGIYYVAFQEPGSIAGTVLGVALCVAGFAGAALTWHVLNAFFDIADAALLDSTKSH